jgi:hypothetical protein
MLITEEVSSFGDYCEQLVDKFLNISNERRMTWWDFIEKTFFTIFR